MIKSSSLGPTSYVATRARLEVETGLQRSVGGRFRLWSDESDVELSRWQVDGGDVLGRVILLSGLVSGSGLGNRRGRQRRRSSSGVLSESLAGPAEGTGQERGLAGPAAWEGE